MPEYGVFFSRLGKSETTPKIVPKIYFGQNRKVFHFLVRFLQSVEVYIIEG